MNNFLGIVLRSIDYKEKDKLLTIATQEGIITVLAKSVRSQASKLKAFTGVLTFGEFSVQEGKTGKILTQVECQESFYNCWTDSQKYTSALLCLEAYEKCFGSEEDAAKPFVLLLKALKEINYNATFPAAIVIWFLLKVSSLMGVDYRQIEEFDKKAVYFLEAMDKLDCVEIDSLEVNYGMVADTLKYFYILFDNDYGIKIFIIKRLINTINDN